MSGPRTAFWRIIAGLMNGLECNGMPHPPEPPMPPPSPEPEPWRVPDLFGPALVELRAALACYDLVDEVARADGHGPTERDRRAHVFAGWALARAAGRAERAYYREVDRGT